MLRFFRKIRYHYLNKKKINKYLLYAFGEIFLVVIGILIAVGIGEWRKGINEQKELISYYNGIQYDLQQDMQRFKSLISLYETSSAGINKEINKMQHDSYNLDSLYSNVPAWMVYVTEFTPNKPTFTEILSSGKLQLFKNNKVKSQLLRVYSNLYPELQFRQNASNEFIRSNRTELLMDTFRWLKILENDGKEQTNLNLENPIAPLNHDWLNDKKSEKYLRFENYLTVTLAAYQGFLLRYKSIILEVETLNELINKELEN